MELIVAFTMIGYGTCVGGLFGFQIGKTMVYEST